MFIGRNGNLHKLLEFIIISRIRNFQNLLRNFGSCDRPWQIEGCFLPKSAAYVRVITFITRSYFQDRWRHCLAEVRPTPTTQGAGQVHNGGNRCTVAIGPQVQQYLAVGGQTRKWGAVQTDRASRAGLTSVRPLSIWSSECRNLTSGVSCCRECVRSTFCVRFLPDWRTKLILAELAWHRLP